MKAAEEVERSESRTQVPETVLPRTPQPFSATPSMTLEEAIELYKSVGERNAKFLFHWLHDIYSRISLPCVSPEYKEILALDKTKMAIFDVIADDLADNYSSRNAVILDELLQIPWRKKSGNNKYLRVGRRLWEDCLSSICDYPRFKDFERVFYFDLHQVVSGMEYSYLVNTVGMDNSIENSVHLPHGCMVILHCDLDLMCSPGFDMAELRNMRVIFHLAQRVAHIGNILNTYSREVVEKDLSCPLISMAVRKGLIRVDEINNESILPKISVLESTFRKRAESYIRRAQSYEGEIRSANMAGFSGALSDLLNRFIARPQYWKLN